MGQRNSNFTLRLKLAASELEPAQPPWWVSQPAGNTPSMGWWWIPAGAEAPAFLGHNHIVAEVNLTQLTAAYYKP